MTPIAVYFAEDVCARLGMSRTTLKRLRRAEAFPIPELPPLDRRPRWSIEEVEAFIASKRRVHGRTVRLRSVVGLAKGVR